MRAASVTVVTLRAADPAASRQWYAEHLQLDSTEDGDGLMIGDLVLEFGERPGITCVSFDVAGKGAVLDDPAGSAVRVVPPAYEEAEQARQHVAEFISGAADLAGPPVADLADAAVAAVERARAEIAALLDGVAHNKVLATQLELSRRAHPVAWATSDATAPVAISWPTSAASTLLSEFIVRGAAD